MPGLRGPPPWHSPGWCRRPWIHYLESEATGVGVVLAGLYVASALAAGLVGFILYRGYRVSGDKALLVMGLGFILISVGSLLDLASGVMGIPFSWIAYLAGYTAIALSSVRVTKSAEALPVLILLAPSTSTALELAGSIAAGVFGLAAFTKLATVRVQGVLLALSHFVEAISLLTAQPLVLAVAIALRAASLASMTVPLAFAVRRGA